ncbi:MAG TPA: hypothetical protein PKA42_03430 [Candidatus Paceibacterota bacterium]|nr:hypothetical protein [Candidatus Paceibacterota bacterium]HMO83194.1 hypothetical protein [Candidatus Paceibacterota bacterium]
MNSIEKRFNKIKNNNPRWAPYVVLAESVYGRKYNHKTIRRNFLKLVPKEDYDLDDEKLIVAELDKLSMTPMDVQNSI